jgi:hypothetical protein
MTVITIVVVAAVLSVTLLLDIGAASKLMILGALGGVCIGLVMFWRDVRPQAGNIDRAAGIGIHNISIQGGIGAGILIVILLGALLMDLPVLRWMALPGLISGVVVGGGIALWRYYND